MLHSLPRNKYFTPYSDIIRGNSSVYVRNKNQGEYTKNTHCETNKT